MIINKKKLTSYLIVTLLVVFGVSSTFSLYNIKAEVTVPQTLTVSISNPSSGSYVNSNNVVISGQVTNNGIPSTQLDIKVYLLNGDLLASTDPIDNKPMISTSEQADGSLLWSGTVTFPDGQYEIYAKVIDNGNPLNTNISSNTIFAVDTKRPKVTSLKLLTQNANPNEVDLISFENLTQVKTDTTITVNFYDETFIDPTSIKDSIVLKNSNGVIFDLIKDTTEQIDQNNIKITYRLASALLTSTTYYLYINPDSQESYITDKAGNKLFPLMKKFTTVSPTEPTDTTKTNFELTDPHGNYMNNGNSCGNCHGIHTSVGSKLEKPNLGTSSTAYCMACHDGTVVAPLPEHSGSTFKHDYQLVPKSSSGGCTACHNPHLTWTKENPNLLKDHFVYQHIDTVQLPEVYDTQNVLCESCHVGDASIVKENANVQYKVMHYRKDTAVGKVDDFALCIRCHNGVKDWTNSNNETVKISNISQFYDSQTPVSTDSVHRFTAADGSPLSLNAENSTGGHIPCAECHNTHGSGNIKGLKGKLGHENRQSFSATTGEWDWSKERQFCLKCHNGSTQLYGVTAKALDPILDGRTGHNVDSNESCSSCHGGESKSFIEAAHAPKQAATSP